MKHLLLSLTSMFFLCTPLMHAEEDEPLFIPMNQTPKTGKRMPPRYMSYLTYYNGEACFNSTQPYAYATIVVTDDTDSVIGSMIVSPEDNCGFLDLQSGCTITCTFDNGTVISTTY